MIDKIESNNNKNVVLGLIFIKFSNDAKEGYHIPKIAQWSYLMDNCKDLDIASKIDAAIAAIEENNNFLHTDFVEDYYLDLNLDVKKLCHLLNVVNDIETFDDYSDEGKIKEILERVWVLIEKI